MPKKILLADDSITIQKVVELTFSDGDYEVTAVNNGAKAVQKLAEMRPDIILSDIIMPEKNGYEVCEYVKSHPEFRNIPVVLLTGTFEPFDPDRAEKAGCDAVVTKPFESQSLIHKVEELIAQAQSNSASAAPPAAAPEPEPEPEPSIAASPWMEEPAPVSAPEPASPFTTSGGSFPTPPEAFTHDADIFSAPPTPQATTEMPFETDAPSPFGAPAADAPAFGGETRAFPKMSFDDLQQFAPAPPPQPEPAPEPSPWDEPASGGETRAFSKMSFDDFQQTPPVAPAPEPETESPFGAPPPVEEFSGETRAFPRMSLEELQSMQEPAEAPQSFVAPEPAYTAPEPAFSAPEPELVAEPSPWDEQPSSPFAAPESEAPAFGGETRAFPKMSFEDLESQMATPAPEPLATEPSPWDEAPEAPAFGGETRAFPKMSFEDLQAQMATPAPAPEPEPAPWESPSASEPSSSVPFEAPSFDAPSYSAPSFDEPTFEEPTFDEPTFAEPAFAEPAFEEPAVPEDLPFASAPEPEPQPQSSEPVWSPAGAAAAEAVAESAEPPIPSSVLAPDSPALRARELSDDQVDRIARRVVELMSDHVVRNIAWEVIPDLAEMVVKERIRQLESEA